jgi:hypothetical protein
VKNLVFKKVFSLLTISAIVVLMVSALATDVQAAVTWQVTITASCGGYSSNTVFGVANDATNGYDPAYDALVGVPPGPGVSAVYSHLDDVYSTSIKAEAPSITWVLKVTPFIVSGEMELSWTSIPSGYSAYIKDSTGTTILADMTSISSYDYSSSASVQVTFQVNAFVIPEFPIGAIIALTACFVSYGAFKGLKRFSYPIA